MSNISLNSFTIDNTLPNQVCTKLFGQVLPNDTAYLIANFINPKFIVKCCQISKELYTLIKTDNDANTNYWCYHLVRRWGGHFKTPTGEFKSEFRIPWPVAKRIQQYLMMDATEKSTLKHLDLIHKPIPCRPIDVDKHHNSVCFINQVLPYIKSDSRKGKSFYYAGYHLRQILRKDLEKENVNYLFEDRQGESGFTFNMAQSYTWLQKAAEKGYIPAGFYLACCLLDDTRMLEFPEHILIRNIAKAIQLLHTASKNNHSEAKVLLETLKSSSFMPILYGNFLVRSSYGGIQISEKVFNLLKENLSVIHEKAAS